MRLSRNIIAAATMALACQGAVWAIDNGGADAQQRRLESHLRIARDFAANSDYAGKETFRKAIASAEQVNADPASGDKERQQALEALKKASKDYLANRPGEWVRIRNGQMWTDDRGREVQAHGAGFILLNDTYYMIGEDRSDKWRPDVNMYSSKDLKHWKFENKIIANEKTHPELGSTRMIERPKLFFNDSTGQFVVWCHWEARDYSASEAGVFVSDSVAGDYRFHSGGRPLGIKSRDCNIFLDDDGTAYFISTIEENTDLGLFRLSDDYLEPVDYTVLFPGDRREAPAIARKGDRYYMLSSACTGWDPNPANLSYTDTLTKGWSPLHKVGNPIAFDTQAASILKVEGSKDTTYLYIGDRWQDPNLPESKTIIFPISFTETDCAFNYVPEFDINFATGEWRPVDPREGMADRSGWSVIESSGGKAGNPVGNVLDGDITTIWIDEAEAPANEGEETIQYFVIDAGQPVAYKGFRATPRSDAGSSEGLVRKYRLETSADGKKWATVSEGDWLPYWTDVDTDPESARYFRFSSLGNHSTSLAEFNLIAQ